MIGILLVQICLIFTTGSEKKYMATGLICSIFALTLVFNYFIIRKFLTFTMICENVKKSESCRCSEQDIEKWRHLY